MDLNNPAHPGHTNQLITTNGLTVSRVWHSSQPILEAVHNELLTVCQSHRKERCGFICADWEVWHVDNSHRFPHHNYFMAKKDAEEVLKQIYQVRESHVIAIWHTHPNNVPWPSPRDIVGWPNLELNWRYLIVTNNDIMEWELSHDAAYSA